MLLNQQQLAQPLSIVINMVIIFAFAHSCASQPKYVLFRKVNTAA